MQHNIFSLPRIIALLFPVISLAIIIAPATARNQLSLGTFCDNTWSVTISYEAGAMHYFGVNTNTGERIELRGAEETESEHGVVYTWINKNFRYKIIWQSSVPNIARLKVIDPNGRTLMARTLHR